MSPSSNGGDDAQVFPDCRYSSIRHCSSCRGGPHCGRCRCSADRAIVCCCSGDRAIVGGASRRQRCRCKTPSHDSAENGNAEADRNAEANGNAERNAASPDTHAPSFCASQVQTKVARVLMCRPALPIYTIPVIPTSLRRLMPLQEGARAVDGARLQLRRLLPGEHRDLGIRAERGDIDRSHQRMRDDVVRQYQHRRLA